MVKLLLAHGANPNPTSNPGAESSPLLEAALAGDAESMQALLDRGARFKDIAGFAIVLAAGADCTKCIDLLVARDLDRMQYTIALGAVALEDNPKLVRLMLQHVASTMVIPGLSTPRASARVSHFQFPGYPSGHIFRQPAGLDERCVAHDRSEV